MKKEIRFYLLWILILSNLFYDEYWGVNALIASFITVLVFGYRFFIRPLPDSERPSSGQKMYWAIGAITWLITGVGVLLGNGWLPVFLYLASFSYFVSLQDKNYISLPLSLAQSFQSGSTGLFRIYTDRKKSMQAASEERSRKIIRQVLQISIGLVICILFLKLYQLADDDFYEMTRFLNLDWISWGFIGFYLLLTWILYGMYFFAPELQINQAEASLKNEISPTYNDRIQDYFGIANEKRMALIVLSILCAMLLLFLSLDIRFILNEYGIQRPVAEYSESVHQGVNSLIFSLILVIILLAYFFRGSLNFNEHKTLKRIAYFWLLLNCVLVVTTGMKNYDYILNFGYTYKRLGVLFYLLLCGVGLAFSYAKIHGNKSVWYLVRNMSLSFLVFFSVVSLFNWNAIISRHNLTHIKTERIDLGYLFELGPDTYPDLMRYHLKNGITDTDLYHILADKMLTTREQLADQRAHSTWRSFNFRDEQLYTRLSKFHFTGAQAERYSTRQYAGL